MRYLVPIPGKKRRYEDKRKVVADYEEAKLVASQWLAGKDEELQVRPTRLSAGELQGAEALSQVLKKLDLDFITTMTWLLKNYEKPARTSF